MEGWTRASVAQLQRTCEVLHVDIPVCSLLCAEDSFFKLAPILGPAWG